MPQIPLLANICSSISMDTKYSDALPSFQELLSAFPKIGRHRRARAAQRTLGGIRKSLLRHIPHCLQNIEFKRRSVTPRGIRSIEYQLQSMDPSQVPGKGQCEILKCYRPLTLDFPETYEHSHGLTSNPQMFYCFVRVRTNAGKGLGNCGLAVASYNTNASQSPNETKSARLFALLDTVDAVSLELRMADISFPLALTRAPI